MTKKIKDYIGNMKFYVDGREEECRFGSWTAAPESEKLTQPKKRDYIWLILIADLLLWGLVGYLIYRIWFGYGI